MRKLIAASMVSLDGYIAGPGGALFDRDGYPYLPMEGPVFSAYNLGVLREAGTLLLGRVTYEMFRAHWPHSLEDPDATQRELAAINDSIHRIVVSDTLAHQPDDDWTDTEIVRIADARGRIAELKRGDGGPIVMFGSHVLWNDLLAAGLLDELHLLVGAVLLGEGVPAFEAAGRASLRLAETRRFEGSSTVLLRYEAG